MDEFGSNIFIDTHPSSNFSKNRKNNESEKNKRKKGKQKKDIEKLLSGNNWTAKSKELTLEKVGLIRENINKPFNIINKPVDGINKPVDGINKPVSGNECSNKQKQYTPNNDETNKKNKEKKLNRNKKKKEKGTLEEKDGTKKEIFRNLKRKYDVFNKKSSDEDREKHLTEFLFGTTGDTEENTEGANIRTNIRKQTRPDRKKTRPDRKQTSPDIDLSQTKKMPAWTDDEDLVRVKDVVSIYSKASGSRGVVEQSENRYKEKLEEKFSQVFGDTPQWAELDRKIVDEDEEEANDLKKKTSVYLSQDEWGRLPNTSLAYKMVSPLNKDRNEGKIIKSIDFLPELKIALVAGCSSESFGVVTLFQFNGKENFKIKSVVFPSFPVKCARFIPSKKQFVVGSNLFSRFFVYDIEKGQKFDIPGRNVKEKKTFKAFEISPDSKYIAFVLSGGQISFYSVNSLSQFEIFQIPCEAKSIAFTNDSNTLYVAGSNGQVYVFDLIEWRCRHCFYDEGCIETTVISLSPNEKLLACGSSSGIINLYQTLNLSSSSNPVPCKVFGCLVTPVTCLAFNSTSEILAAASSLKENAIKLIHTRSMTVFANFPGAYVFKRINTLSFSPDSKYLVIGDNNQKANLCRLFYY